jgi:hypothetical protein
MSRGQGQEGKTLSMAFGFFELVTAYYCMCGHNGNNDYLIYINSKEDKILDGSSETR